MADLHKPGERAPRSGYYKLVDKKGENIGAERVIFQGDPFPPTPEKGMTYSYIKRPKGRPVPYRILRSNLPPNLITRKMADEAVRRVMAKKKLESGA
jgi:hypothetical protein